MSVRMLEARQATGPSSQQHHLSPPYPPTTANLGGVPTVDVDIPLCAVFLFLFILGAISHMTIFQVNRRRGHKFLISGMMFGFCMSRIVTMIMRMVWATRPTNIKVGIAAEVFVYAGVVLLFVVNVVFSQRIVRACHPRLGWSIVFHWAFPIIYFLIATTLLMLIASVIQSFYTLNANTKRIDRDILLYGQTFYAFISFLPIILVIGGLVIPRKSRVEKFGHGRFRAKVGYLIFASFITCLGASFRAGTNYAGGSRPSSNPPPYYSKACFYIFNFTVEIIMILLYVIIRVDKRFYVPDHSKAAGDYSRGPDFYTKRAMERDGREGRGVLENIIEPEEETFDDQEPVLLKDGDEEMYSMADGRSGGASKAVSTKPSTEPLNFDPPQGPSAPSTNPPNEAAKIQDIPPAHLMPGLQSRLPPTPATTPPPGSVL